MADTPHSVANTAHNVDDMSCGAANTALDADDMSRGAADTVLSVVDTLRSVVNTATYTAFTSFLANFEHFSKCFQLF